MTAVPVDASAAADPGLGGPVPVRAAGPAAAGRSPAAARPVRSVRSWPLLVLAVPAAAEVWSGWVGIAKMTGFGLVWPLPGIWPSLHLDTAITLPAGVEAYAAYALRAWLARDHAVSDRTRRFAKWSAVCSFALGMAGQVAYHLMTQAGMDRAPWPVTTMVSCLPVLVLAMGTALAHMLRTDAEAAAAAGSRAGPPAVPRSASRPGPEQAGAAATSPMAAGTGPQTGTTLVPDQDHDTAAGSPGLARGPRTDRRNGQDCRPQAGRGGPASIAARVARRRRHGLERVAERSGAHDQCRARATAAPAAGP
jgi:hypothetical protein